MRTVSRSADHYLYEQVEQRLRDQIETGVLKPGDKAPSLRRMSQQARVSLATVMQAYLGLEHKGFLESRPKSGFYVCRRRPQEATIPRSANPRTRPRKVKVGDIVETILTSAHESDVTSLGVANPSPELLPTKALSRALIRVNQRRRQAGVRYSLPQGIGELRRQIAYRTPQMGYSITPDEIIITNGATEAMAIALQCVARHGDIVAVESPCYFQVMQLIEGLGMLAVEVKTDAEKGMQAQALLRVLNSVDVKAVITVANFSNPMGSLIPDAEKQRIVELLAQRSIPLIDNDVYGDLHFAEQRPRAMKSFDTSDNVLYCSSFSKTIAPGYRVGWLCPGRFARRASLIKRSITGVSASLPQLAIAEFLATENYDRILRKVRHTYADQLERARYAVCDYFPKGTRITRPQGGFVLWLELPGGIDGEQLFYAALAEGVSIIPGALFSPTRKFKNYIRLACGLPWDERIKSAIATIGQLAGDALTTQR